MAEHNASAYTDYTPLQRLALLSWWLARGEVVTTDKAAVVLGGTCDAAHAQLTDLIAVIPIAAEHDRWQRVTTSPMQQPPVTPTKAPLPARGYHQLAFDFTEA